MCDSAGAQSLHGNGVKTLLEGEYKEYLRVISKFHHYSFNNTMLIALQKPDASLIAGFSAWKNTHGRTVKKGEKGMKTIFHQR